MDGQEGPSGTSSVGRDSSAIYGRGTGGQPGQCNNNPETAMGEWVQVGWGKGVPESARNMVKGVNHLPRIGLGDVLEE